MSNLFTEVSVEQQEIVSGGAPAQAIDFTAFTSALNAVGTASTSGPNGTTVITSGASDRRLTFGLGVTTLDTTVPALPTFTVPHTLIHSTWLKDGVRR